MKGTNQESTGKEKKKGKKCKVETSKFFILVYITSNIEKNH